MLANSINRFAADLYARLAHDEKSNLFFSPFSIETALAMTAAGARGKTLEEMQKALHLPQNPHEEFGKLIGHLTGSGSPKPTKQPYELSVANAIWAQQDFPWHKEFLDLTRKHYGAGLVETDFAKSEEARKQINDWVEKETRKKIQELIEKGIISAATRMVLTNAIYFKGDWQTKFDKKHTKDAPFTRDDGTKVNVPLMTREGEFNYGEFTTSVTRQGEKVQVLELPYLGKKLSMFVFLPANADGVNQLAQWLSADQLPGLKMTPEEVIVGLPRFKVESSFSLKPVLMDMGMKQAFDEPRNSADFTGMSPEGKNLFISEVLHKAFVEVNEEGSEAAAATAVL